jgi:hypothetical protein
MTDKLQPVTYLFAAFGLLLSLGHPAVTGAEERHADTVAVLDFVQTGQGSTDWTAGLADVLEIHLQKQGVPTFVRRQLRLVLSERGQIGLLDAESLRATPIPRVGILVSGKLVLDDLSGFKLIIEASDARQPLIRATVVEAGSGHGGVLDAVESAAKRLAEELRSGQPTPVTGRRRSRSITWVPEAAQSFFRATQFHGQGDWARAMAAFREARNWDPSFSTAVRWEARIYREQGFPELESILLTRYGLTPLVSSSTGSVAKVPIVAVVCSPGIPVEIHQAFCSSLNKGGRFRVLLPEWIGMTSDELDLVFTGEMAADKAENFWLKVDLVATLRMEEDPTRRPVEGRLLAALSGVLQQVATVESGSRRATEVADELVSKLTLPVTTSGGDIAASAAIGDARSLEPNADDAWETALPKVMALLRQQPHSARYIIGLADLSDEFEVKRALLDRAVLEIGQNRSAEDASFLLTSALWRRRVAGRTELVRRRWATPWTNMPLAVEFKDLLAWFPASPDSLKLAETNAALRDSSIPVDSRYLQGVFSGNRAGTGVPTGHTPAKDDPIPQPTLMERLVALSQAERKHDYSQLNSLRASVTREDCRAAMDQARQKRQWSRVQTLASWGQGAASFSNDLKAVVERRREEEAAFPACSQLPLDSPDALPSLDRFLRSGFLDVREKAILRGVEILQQTQTRADWAAFVGRQIQAYERDLEMPLPAYWLWTYAGELRRCNRLTESASLLESLQTRPDLSKEERQTAEVALAATLFWTGQTYEALQMAKRLSRDGATSPLTWPYASGERMWSSKTVGDCAVELLKRIRTLGLAPLSRCFGPLPSLRPLAKDEREKLDSLLNKIEGTGDKHQLGPLAREAMPLLTRVLYETATQTAAMPGADADRPLRVCVKLGPRAAPAAAAVTQHLLLGENRLTAAGALWAIGKPAAAAVPVLILDACSKSDNWNQKNAEFALNRVGVAPRHVVPILARMLEHDSMEIAIRAAKELRRSAAPSPLPAQGVTGEDDVATVMKWWTDEGAYQDWSDSVETRVETKGH